MHIKKASDKLNEWFQEEKKKGLVDIKFFGCIPNGDLESACEEALHMLTTPISTNKIPEGF